MEANGLNFELTTSTGIMTILEKKYSVRADRENFYFNGLIPEQFIDELLTQKEKEIFLQIFKQIGEQLCK